jgi:glycerophosphoryl diester phosphodiesterase
MAFENARRLGMDLLELDCYLTKDKQVVVVHDSDLSRLCVKCNAEVDSFNFADLPRVQVQPLLPPEFHLHGLRLEPYWTKTADGKMPAEVAKGQPIPLLEEVFRTFPDATINIDCKIPDIELVDKVGWFCFALHVVPIHSMWLFSLCR